jgi:hypothetical protein
MRTNRHPARRFAPPVLSVFVALAAALAGCIQGQGPVTSETREVTAFTRIEVTAGIRVVVRIGPAEAIEVSAQANLLPAIATQVGGETLRIEARDDFTTVEPVTVTVVIPALDGITLSGGSRAEIDGLEATSIQIDIRGGASATLVGAADVVELTADGGAVADLQDLSAGTMALRLSGGAKATVNASDAVTGSASGGSSLTVFGDAELRVETSGASEVARER